MARGDGAGSSIVSVAAAGNLDFQPAAGVEVLIREMVGGLSTSVGCGFFDGVNRVDSQTTADAASRGKIVALLTNAIYGRINNGTAGAVVCAMRGVQTK